MIKIIKEGKIKKHKCSCKECGCIFEFDAQDVDIHTIKTWDRYNYQTVSTCIFFKIECPYCYKMINVYEDFTEEEEAKMKYIFTWEKMEGEEE